MLIVAAIDGHARLLCLDCSPAEGGVRVGRLVAEVDLEAASYAGFRVTETDTKEAVTVRLPEPLEAGMYRDFLIGVDDGEQNAQP